MGAVEHQVGVPVDHVAGVDFAGFASLVDRIGGIDIRVDGATRDTSSGLYLDEPGCVTLDGDTALALVRSRKLELLQADGTWQRDPYSDLRRIENQRIVVTAALLGLDELGWSPGDMRDQVEWAVDHLTIDDGLSLDDLVQLGRAAASLGAEDVTGTTLPVVPDPLDRNRLAADPAAAPAAVAAFVAGETSPANPPAGVGPPPPVTGAAPVVAPC